MAFLGVSENLSIAGFVSARLRGVKAFAKHVSRKGAPQQGKDQDYVRSVFEILHSLRRLSGSIGRRGD